MIHGIYFNYKDIEGKEEKIKYYLKNQKIDTKESIYMASPLFSYIYDRIDKKYPNKEDKEKLRLAALIYSNNFQKINNEIDTEINNEPCYMNCKLSDDDEIKTDLRTSVAEISSETVKNTMDQQNNSDNEKDMMNIDNVLNRNQFNYVFKQIDEFLNLSTNTERIRNFIEYLKGTTNLGEINYTTLLKEDVVALLLKQIITRKYIVEFAKNITKKEKNEIPDKKTNFELFDEFFKYTLDKCRNIESYFDLFNINLLMDDHLSYLFDNMYNDIESYNSLMILFTNYDKVIKNIHVIYMEYITQKTGGDKKSMGYKREYFLTLYNNNKDDFMKKILESYKSIKKDIIKDMGLHDKEFVQKITKTIDKVINENFSLNDNFIQNSTLVNFLLDLIKLYVIIPCSIDNIINYDKMDIYKKLDEIANIVIFTKLDFNDIEKNDKYIKNKYKLFTQVVDYVQKIMAGFSDINLNKINSENIIKLCEDMNELFDKYYDGNNDFKLDNEIVIEAIKKSINEAEKEKINNNIQKIRKEIGPKIKQTIFEKSIKPNYSTTIDKLLVKYSKISYSLLTNSKAIGIIFSIVNNNSDKVQKMYDTFSEIQKPKSKEMSNKKLLQDFVLVILENIYDRKNIFENKLKVKKINDFLFYDADIFLGVINLILSTFNNDKIFDADTVSVKSIADELIQSFPCTLDNILRIN